MKNLLEGKNKISSTLPQLTVNIFLIKQNV